MLYLIHEDSSGDPVGIWNQKLEHFYKPDAKYFQVRGEAMVPKKPDHLSWNDWAAKLVYSFNPHSNWYSVDYPEMGLPSALNKAMSEVSEVPQDESQ